MSKKAKLKNTKKTAKAVKKSLDPFTNASDIQNDLLDKKKNKRTPQEKNRRDRHLQKEIVRQLTDELVKLSEKDILEDTNRDNNPHNKVNEVIYTIRPVDYKE